MLLMLDNNDDHYDDHDSFNKDANYVFENNKKIIILLTNMS